MKGKFDAYALAKKFQNWIVDRSTAHNFTVSQLLTTWFHEFPIDLKIWVSELGNLWKHVVNRSNPNEFCKKKIVRSYWYDNIPTTY